MGMKPVLCWLQSLKRDLSSCYHTKYDYRFIGHCVAIAQARPLFMLLGTGRDGRALRGGCNRSSATSLHATMRSHTVSGSVILRLQSLKRDLSSCYWMRSAITYARLKCCNRSSATSLHATGQLGCAQQSCHALQSLKRDLSSCY